MAVPRIPVESPVAGPGGTLTQAWSQFFQASQALPGNQTTIAVDYTVDPNDGTVFCGGSAGLTLTFPVSPATAGKIWFVFNEGTGTITFAASSGAVKGLASIGAGAGATVMTDGVNLFVKN